MGFGDFKDKAQEMGKEHGDKVNQGMDKAGDMAKDKFGHEEQVDQATDKGKDMLGSQDEGGDQQQQ